LISKVSERVHECYRGKESVLEKELRKALLGINILVNGGLGIVIVLFNIFFLLNSNDVNEAILNSVALFFILEIDEELRPDWDEVHFDRRIAANLFQIRCDDRHYDGVQVDVESSISPQDCLHLLETDDINNEFLYEAKEEEDQLVINVYASEDCIRIKFCISGENGRDFFDMIKKFDCFKSYSFTALLGWESESLRWDWNTWRRDQDLEEGLMEDPEI
jgi:hypothetical protein